MKKWILASSAVGLAAALVLPSCVEKFGADCTKSLTCGNDSSSGVGGTGGSAGAAGNANAAGADGGGGATGGASGGASSGSAGMAGASATCECRDEKPVCDRGRCVECSNEEPCKGEALCDDDGECVECLANAHCKDPSRAACVDGACVPCGDDGDDDCAHFSDKRICDAGECVQCTGKKYEYCPRLGGVAQVCDSNSRTCSGYQERSAGGLCKPCVSDAHCPLGQLCMLQEFGEAGEAVGYFCQWEAGYTTSPNGAPQTCLPPYVGLKEGAESIDETLADVCVLEASTCEALNDYYDVCATTGTGGASGDDSLCGFDAPNDALCVQAGTGNYRCTMRCNGDDDCPVGTCNKGVIPFRCNF
jgi:hypothetical protein